MKDILEEIVAYKRKEVEAARQALPERELHRSVEAIIEHDGGIATRSMSKALAASATGIISEFKRKSPSKGWIKEDARPEDIVPDYEKAGAAACSILTDEKFFGGCQEFIQTVRPLVSLPLLRKDFIIDEYQLFEARRIGADAVLLIAACLSLDTCRTLMTTAHELGLEVLLEVHHEHELDYCDLDAEMIGVNNRNLGTFITDVQNSFRLIDRLPSDRILVSESGISHSETIRLLRAAGFRGFLIGETFMRTAAPADTLRQLIADITNND
ncbi:MAG: indole-3-glycerol phosphate synthase TrpC [Bacteroidaceae bacterium]|nr:indole-3-glycerol phosphate synthase TrpC [Bacteroidaceae bacterium]